METDGEGGEEEGEKRNLGMEEGRGKVTVIEGMGGMGQDMGWNGEEEKGRG